jgi:hypothetical protein
MGRLSESYPHHRITPTIRPSSSSADVERSPSVKTEKVRVRQYEIFG